MSTIPDRSDAKAFAKYKYDTEIAFYDGAKIETEFIGQGDWTPCRDPQWFWNKQTYRIAEPKPTHVPYSFESAPEVLKVQRKDNGAAYVAHLANCHGYELPYGTQGSVSFEKLLRDFEQLNGEPCGTKVEGEDVWPKYYTNKERTCVWRFKNDGVGELWHECDKKWSGNLFVRKSIADDDYVDEITATEAAKLTGGKL